MTYLQAITDGLREEMRRDERVFVMGEDIATYGGAFKVTDGLAEEFGDTRVMDTPMAEAAHHRDGDRGGRRGDAPGLRDAVRGLRGVLALTSWSTSPGRCTTARASPCRSCSACRRAVGFSGGPFPLAEPRGVVDARAGPEGAGAVDGG